MHFSAADEHSTFRSSATPSSRHKAVPRRHAPHRTAAIRAAAVVCLLLVIVNVALAMLFAMRHPGIVEFISEPSAPRFEALGLILLDEVNEEPHITPASSATGPHPLCAGVDARQVRPFIRAFALMRGTERGNDLYDTLVANDVCVTVKEIPFNGGYATSWRTTTGTWIHGTITLDDSYVSTRQADVLAAMLVHEATHIERAINGESCHDDSACEALPNGVDLEEEVAAHAAEAEWWLAAYGKDGKRFAFGADYGENRLLNAYLDGFDAFSEYIRALRSDPREGSGI